MEYILVRMPEEGKPFLEALKKAEVLAVDTETTGLDVHQDRLRMIQIAVPGQPVLLIDCFSFLKENRQEGCISDGKGTAFLREVLEGESAKIFHNAKFDLQFLRKAGVCVNRVFDSMLAAELLRPCGGPRKVNLASVAFHYLGEEVDKTEQTGDWSGHLTRTQLEYAALYAFSGKPSYQLTLWGGEEALDVNFDSNAYVLRLLRENGIPVMSTSHYSLAPYQKQPLVKALTDYRKYAKLLSGFLHPLPAQIHPVTGRLHPRYGQIGAYSGRMCCWGPNIQQIPRESRFRGCFTAPKGRKLVLADYSQIELRVAAQISGDVRMKNAYANGEDLHRLTASLISDITTEEVTPEQRQAAKAVNFGLIFGMGAAGLRQYAAQSYGVDMTLEEAKKFRDSFFRAYAGISWWHHDLKTGIFQEGRTLTGRKFLFTPRSGVAILANTPVQGTAADILKRALGLLFPKIAGRDWKIVGIIHDEILLEVPETEAPEAAVSLKMAMENAGKDILPSVPCAAEARAADSWAEK